MINHVEHSKFKEFDMDTENFAIRCIVEKRTVARDGVNLRFESGDGVVKNVPESKAAVFEVSISALRTFVDACSNALFFSPRW